MHGYIFDDASAFEYKRLDLMSKILDPWTRRYLTEIGVGEGWRCLELGGGNGSNAEWLAATVGPTGSVTAIDINPVLLELVPAQNLTVRQMDVRTGDLPSNSYDLVTCRAMLHQISEYAPAVLAQMASAVKPGGWLLVQEPDFHLAFTTEPDVWASTWKGSIGSSDANCQAWSANWVWDIREPGPTCRT
jgi:ubiquinone/menaquinone biosynthesis C-methylase UbiE